MAETYTITRMQKVSILTAEGIPTPGRRIHFQVKANNFMDWVELPDSEFSVEAVSAAIEPIVAVHLELTGD